MAQRGAPRNRAPNGRDAEPARQKACPGKRTLAKGTERGIFHGTIGEPMRFHLLLSAFALCALCTACFRNETTRFEMSVPDMTVEADAARIRAAFSDMLEKRTVTSFEADLGAHKIVCDFNNRELGECNLLYAVARAGYDANDWKALPADVAERQKVVPK
jgi:hypothetical protein